MTRARIAEGLPRHCGEGEKGGRDACGVMRETADGRPSAFHASLLTRHESGSDQRAARQQDREDGRGLRGGRVELCFLIFDGAAEARRLGRIRTAEVLPVAVPIAVAIAAVIGAWAAAAGVERLRPLRRAGSTLELRAASRRLPTVTTLRTGANVLA